MKKKIILALLMLSFFAGLFAQADSTVFDRFPSALGAYANTSTTGGLSYQHWFGKFGAQVALGGIYLPDGGSYDYNIQLGLQYLLYREDFADWFSGGLYASSMIAHRGFPSGIPQVFTPTEYLGLGVGVEVILLRHLAWNIEAMYVVSYPFEVAISGSLGIRYRF